MNVRDGHRRTVAVTRRGRLALAACGLVAAVAGLGAGGDQSPRNEPPPVPRTGSPPDPTTAPLRIFVTSDAAVVRSESGDHVRSAGTITVEYELDGSAITLTMSDGDELSVTIDGVTVPRERLRREKGGVVVLDEQGNERHRLRLIRGLPPGFRRPPRDAGEFITRIGVEAGADGELGWVTKLPSYGFEFEPPPVMMGVFTRETPESLEKHLHLEVSATVMVTGLHEGLPAHRAGLQQHDIILSVDGHKPVTRGMILETLRDKQPGDALSVDILQAGSPRSCTIELEAFDAERMASATLIGEPPYGRGRSFGGPGPGRDGMNRREGHRRYEGYIVTPEGDNLFVLPGGDNAIFGGQFEAIVRQIIERKGEGGATEQELRILLQKSRETNERIEQMLKSRKPGQDRP